MRRPFRSWSPSCSSAPTAAHAGAFDAPAAPALAGTLPAGFTETTVWSGLKNPMALRFASDGRVFVARRAGSSTSSTTSTTRRRPLRGPPRSRPRLLGPRPARAGARPRFHQRPAVRLRPLRLRQAPDSADRAALGRRLPVAARADQRRLRGHRPALAARPRPGDGAEGPDRGLVPAVPEPLDRLARLRPRTACSTSAAGDGACFNFADYGQNGSPVNPCGDPPARHADAARRRRAARCARRTSAVRPSRRRSTARSCASNPDTGAAAAGNPRSQIAGSERAAGSSPTACATRSGSRSVPAPTRSGRATSAGTPGRRSTGPRPRAPVENYGWPCYEGAAGWAATTRRT